MTQPRGVSLPPFGQCLCIAKLAVAHIIHKYRGANFAKRGHNCLTNKALRRTGQSAIRVSYRFIAVRRNVRRTNGVILARATGV